MSILDDLPGLDLPRLARAAIAARFGHGEGEPLTHDGLDPRLLAPGASFVTLTLERRLRGCVGTLRARRPLAEDVEANACAAAFEDPRFPPLREDELAATRVEVSVLGELVELRARDRGELLRQLVSGEDGLVVEVAGRRATFLPQVWAALPEPGVFVEELGRKAGIEDNLWNQAPSFFRYRVRKWGE